MRSFEVRRAIPEDAPAIHAIRSHPVTSRYQPLHSIGVKKLERMLAERGSVPLDPTLSGKAQWTIEIRGVPAGWVTVDVTSREHHIANLGYTLDPRHHGHGVTSAAVQLVIPTVFDPNQLAIERLEAVAAIDNIASRRVLEKCGFGFEGIAREYLIISGRRVDHARYARLREDRG